MEEERIFKSYLRLLKGQLVSIREAETISEKNKLLDRLIRDTQAGIDDPFENETEL
jgi:hypothetical protein